MNRHILDEAYIGREYETNVWVSESADRAIGKWGNSREAGRLGDKVEYWAKSGFWKWEGSANSGRPIVHEWDGVFRLGYQSLHRMLGFYENDNKRSFLIVDAYLKKGKGLNRTEKGYIDEVARVKKLGLWEKRS